MSSISSVLINMFGFIGIMGVIIIPLLLIIVIRTNPPNYDSLKIYFLMGFFIGIGIMSIVIIMGKFFNGALLFPIMLGVIFYIVAKKIN